MTEQTKAKNIIAEAYVQQMAQTGSSSSSAGEFTPQTPTSCYDYFLDYMNCHVRFVVLSLIDIFESFILPLVSLVDS
jgi:hypothetical protein